MSTIENDRYDIRSVKIRDHKDAMHCHRGFPLGNPFEMNGDESKRDEVCDKYEEYFQKKVAEEDPAIMSGLAQCVKYAIENGYVKLGCFCHPKRCHTNTIVRYLEGVLNP
jgi:hypothetical protein